MHEPVLSQAVISALEQVAARLRITTDAERTTIRLRTADDAYPVVAEALASGVGSLRGKPAVRQQGPGLGPLEVLERELRTVVQNDVEKDAPVFPILVSEYKIRAQMLAPLVDGERLGGLVSVHSTKVRVWSPAEREAITRAAVEAEELLWKLQHEEGA